MVVMINYDDFKKVEITIGEIKSVDEIEKSDKLLLLAVDFGEDTPRTVVSGIKKYFEDPQSLISKKVGFVTNLEPRPIMGYESQGMILAANSDDAFSLMEVSADIPAGTKIS